MTPDTILFLGILAATIILAFVAYRIGQREGAASERIKLYGNTLPRFENPPAPPKYKEVPLDEVSGKYNFSQPPQWCTPVTREVEEKEKGVPTMPNHPDMPERLGAASYAKDYLKEHPEATREQAYVHGFMLATDLALAANRILKVKESLSAVTQDQLIDALMDMRLESFIAAHCKFAHAGTDLYYLSRKETAEYLLDMYYITPKAKH